jgi:trigger factor
LRDKTLAGKRAIFDVEIVEAAKRIIPEVSDEFANRVRPGLTADSLLAELKKAVDEEDSKEFVPARNKALGEALAQVVEVDVPDTLVTNQAREKFAVMMADMRDNGVDDDTIQQQITPENFNKYKAIVRDGIVKDFKVSMATDEIARLEGINVPDYQVQEQMESIRKDAAEHKEEIDDNLIRAKVETTLQRQAVYDWLAERSALKVEYVTDKDESFDEALMERLAEESLRREQELAAASSSGESSVERSPAAASAIMDAVVVEESASAASTATTEAEVATAPAGETEDEKQARYANMSLEERAYQILKDIGSV